MADPKDDADRSDIVESTEAVTNSNFRSSDALCQHYDRFRRTISSSQAESDEEEVDRVRDGDHVLLHFADGRQIFAHCISSRNRRHPPLVRIQKRNYPTDHLIGLPYGTILEQEGHQLRPILDPSAKLIPELMLKVEESNNTDDGEENETNKIVTKDNRSLVDTNTAQRIDYNELMRMRQEGVSGASIVATMIDNSTTYQNKTAFAQTKYVLRKLLKHQPRCRLVRCRAATIIEALYLKDPKRIRNLRDDTVGQILSYANVAAGRRVLVMESCLGLVLGAVAERMGGYGQLFSLYEGQQPACLDLLAKFNLTFAEMNAIQWVHCGDVFTEHASADAATSNIDGPFDPAINNNTTMDTAMDANMEETSQESTKDSETDLERLDREILKWPCELHSHTRQYLERQQAHATVNGTDRPIVLTKSKAAHTIYSFLCKRAARFARKLCRHTSLEARCWLNERPCDSLILATRYDPTETLLQLFPYLAPSGPFVIYSEFIEPLTHCFRAIQENPQLLSINLRLSDTWMREYQVLDGRTHPNMTMSQSGGFILTGIKLDPTTGHNELSETALKEIRDEIGGRRARQKRKIPPDPKNPAKSNAKRKMQTKQDIM